MILVLRFFMRLTDEINRNTDATVKGLFPPLCIFRWLEILCIYSLYTVISLTLPGSFIKLCLFINSDRLLIYIMSFFCIVMQYKHFLTSLYIIVGYWEHNLLLSSSLLTCKTQNKMWFNTNALAYHKTHNPIIWLFSVRL